MTIKRWKDRIKDGQPSAEATQAAMQNEIAELRKALWWSEYRLVEARQQRDEHRRKVSDYQKKLADIINMRDDQYL